jgi:hypothetical protein
MTDTPATGSHTFTKYASRLRTLELDEKCPQSDVFPILSILRLARLQPDIPLFPRLEHISFPSPEITQLQAAYAELTTLCPVTKLEFLGLHTETSSFIQVLSLFHLSPHSLRDLKLHLPEPGRYFDMGSMQYLQNFDALRSLSITSRNRGFPIFDLMVWIARIEHLQNLHVDVRVYEDAPDFIHGTRSNALSIRLVRFCGPFSFIRATIPIFLDVTHRVKLELSGVESATEGNEIASFIPSLNHPDVYVTLNEPE